MRACGEATTPSLIFSPSLSFTPLSQGGSFEWSVAPDNETKDEMYERVGLVLNNDAVVRSTKAREGSLTLFQGGGKEKGKENKARMIERERERGRERERESEAVL